MSGCIFSNFFSGDFHEVALSQAAGAKQSGTDSKQSGTDLFNSIVH
jgi:hypothetical protein